MKKIIALVLSVVMMFSCLGIAASATNVVGRSSYPLGKPPVCTTTCPKPERPTIPVCPPPCPTKPECTTKEECTTIINNVTNVTNNNITIMPEEDPTTLLGFLYRIIKTVVPYLYKILSLFNIEISFGGNNAACGNCGSNSGCNCGNGGVNDDYIIVLPTLPDVEEPTGGVSGDSGSDSDSADSDSDSIDSILGGLFGDLFA
ncbi:MAG: hypothetical protein E7523_00885 [Ruminococcaceae bacterium]|nr:hypothetical protein [Oscillospiraceae bacterium]